MVVTGYVGGYDAFGHQQMYQQQTSVQGGGYYMQVRTIFDAHTPHSMQLS